MRSRVIVLLDVNTNDANVDIDADNTNKTTSPIRASGKPSNIPGIMESKSGSPLGSVAGVPKSLPKPPKK